MQHREKKTTIWSSLSRGYIKRVCRCKPVYLCIITLMILSSSSLADYQSHYEAAYLLVKHVHENRQLEFAKSVVHRILSREPLLEPYKDDIDEIISTYFMSEEYKEMRINAVMHYFTEQEIRDITIAIQNPAFTSGTGKRSALLKKYENVFSRLERLFIQHIEEKLKTTF